jgi:hypothetical protein
MQFTLGGFTFTAPDKIGVGYQDNIRTARFRLFRKYMNDNPDERESLHKVVTGALKVMFEQWLSEAQTDGDARQATRMQELLENPALSAIYEPTMFDSWLTAHKKDYEVRLALLRQLLTATDRKISIERAYNEGTEEEVAAVEDFFTNASSPKPNAPQPSASDGQSSAPATAEVRATTPSTSETISPENTSPDTTSSLPAEAIPQA